VIKRIADLLKHETAGEPMHGLKWTRKTTRKVARQLRRLNIRVSAKTVGRLLKAMGFSLRVNHKAPFPLLMNTHDPCQTKCSQAI